MLHSNPQVVTARNFKVRMICGSKTMELLTAFTASAKLRI
jgi:hypothetical protein